MDVKKARKCGTRNEEMERKPEDGVKKEMSEEKEKRGMEEGWRSKVKAIIQKK